jgi:hypothetical protein
MNSRDQRCETIESNAIEYDSDVVFEINCAMMEGGGVDVDVGNGWGQR